MALKICDADQYVSEMHFMHPTMQYDYEIITQPVYLSELGQVCLPF
jgi:hypothetical protein